MSGDAENGKEEEVQACLIRILGRHQEQAIQQMDQSWNLTISPLYIKGAFCGAVIQCSVQQPVVVVVHAATAPDQDGERKTWSTMCWQFNEKPRQTSASWDNATKAMADLRGHFTLWKMHINMQCVRRPWIRNLKGMAVSRCKILNNLWEDK